MIVFGIMVLGIVAGVLLRPVPNIKILNNLIMGFIYLLLFFLGLAVGGNEEIIANLTTLGLEALIITVAALLGSVVVAKWLYQRYFRESVGKDCSSKKRILNDDDEAEGDKVE